MRLPLQAFTGIVILYRKLADLTAGLAGVNKAFYAFNIGFNGRSEKRELGLRSLDQVVPEVCGGNVVADKSDDNADQQDQGDCV